MISQQMAELSLFKHSLLTKIFNIEQCQQINRIKYCKVTTQFGYMTLVIEKCQLTQKDLKKHRKQQIINKYTDIFPLIYQQIFPVVNEYLYCLTLMQEIMISQKIKSIKHNELKQLVLCAFKLQLQTNYTLELSQYNLQKIFITKRSNKKYFDFTALTVKNDHHSEQKNVQLFAQIISKILVESQQFYKYIIIIKQKVYKLNYRHLAHAIYWFQLALWFNFIPKFRVSIINNEKLKEMQIARINGEYDIIYKDRKYNKFDIVDGQCINILEQKSIQELRKKFFMENILYVVEKTNFTIVKKILTEQQQQNNQYIHQLPRLPDVPTNVPYDKILIRKNITKIQFVNFFITYFSYIKPILTELKFYQDKNSIRLNLSTKVHERIIIDLIFHHKYVVKDQQVSMILEKASLDRCKVILTSMKITDSLLLFLANSEKMMKTIELNLSSCEKLTQPGLTSLLISPYCKNLQVLNLSKLAISQMSIQAITKKLLKLTKLNIQSSAFQGIISLKNVKLYSLEALGFNVELNFYQTLSILRLDCQLTLQGLNSLIKLPLKQLRLKLIDNKKGIMNVFGNFYKQSNPVKTFAESNIRKFLKKLDLSNSNIKFKVLKPIFNMPQLEMLILNNYDKIGHEIDHICSNIMSISLENTTITISQLSHLLNKIPGIAWLNIVNTQIRKKQIYEYLLTHKKYIHTLQLSEEQYSNKFLQEGVTQVQCVKLHVNRLLNSQSQYVLNHLLFKSSQSKKTIFLHCDTAKQRILVHKVVKYLANTCAQVPKNIHINNLSYLEVINKPAYNDNQTQYIQVDGGQIVQRWRDNQAIDSFTYHLIKATKQYPEYLLGVNLCGNKVLGKEAIKMLRVFGNNKIKWINFRDCIFKFYEIQDVIFAFPFLQKVNQNSYQLIIKGQNFIDSSQKYLKFFMRVLTLATISVQVYNVQQSSILYSVLFHIIDHHHATITSLRLKLNNVAYSGEDKTFWNRVCELIHLKNLQICIEDVSSNFNYVFDSINNLNLHTLTLNIPFRSLPILNLKQLKQLNLNLNDQLISDSVLGKTIKLLPSLNSLRLSTERCPNINNLNKLSCISSIDSLQNLQLSFQYCNLKQSSLFEFMECLKDLKKLQKLQINISFTTQNWNEMLKVIQTIKQTLRHTYIKIFAVNKTSNDFIFNRQEFSLKGIQIIM